MSEDSNQLPGEQKIPEPRQEQVLEEPGLPAQYPPASEVYIQPEEPRPTEPQYPPSPEFYRQMEIQSPPVVQNPYSAPPSSYAAPPPGYGVPTFPPAPGYGYDYPSLPQAQPLPLGQAIRELPGQYKKILFKPGARSFAEEQGKADWGIIWVQLLFLFVVAILFSLPDDLAGSSNAATNLLGTLGLAVFAPLLFFAIVGIQYLLARAFKGTGSFKQQAYNQLLFQVPLGVATTIVSLPLSWLTASVTSLTTSTSVSSGAVLPLLVALLIDLVVLVIGVYSIVLNVFSIMATHRLSGGKATAAVLIPYGALFLAFCAIAFAGIAAFGAISTAQP